MRHIAGAANGTAWIGPWVRQLGVPFSSTRRTSPHTAWRERSALVAYRDFDRTHDIEHRRHPTAYAHAHDVGAITHAMTRTRAAAGS